MSLAFFTVAAFSMTGASFAYEASDATPQAEIIVDPSMIENDSSDIIVFGEPSEVLANIPDSVVKADARANASRAAEPEETAEFINDNAGSLAELVSQQEHDDALDREMQCLAGTVYFESKGETLAGQLAVAKVVLARAASGRFPDTVCGVVYQRSQFSFVRGGTMPRINTASSSWKNAVAIAKIAVNKAWKSPVEGALFFHARRVSPGWKLQRIAAVDNHVFYR